MGKHINFQGKHASKITTTKFNDKFLTKIKIPRAGAHLISLHVVYLINTFFYRPPQSGAGIPALGSPEFCRCPCTHCKSVLRDTAHWTNIKKEAPYCDVKIGDRVLVNEKFTGVVKYVGDLDSSYTHDQLFVGVKLDDPGDNL